MGRKGGRLAGILPAAKLADPIANRSLTDAKALSHVLHGLYRRQGIGSAVTLAALETARQQGCRLGVLFSSPMAASMDEGLGFRRYGTGHCHLWSPEGKAEKTCH